MEAIIKIFNAFKDTKTIIITALSCTTACIIGKYRNFDVVEFGSFKLSFDFMFFLALVASIVCWLLLIRNLFGFIYEWIKKVFILKNMKNSTLQEKDFLYNRVYGNGNELTIDMTNDAYFYEKIQNGTLFTYKTYKKSFETKEKIIKFLRGLENKQIIKNYGNQSMIITNQVWDLLIKNADDIFKDFSPLPIEPTEEKIKWAKIMYSTMQEDHKILLQNIMRAPCAEYKNVKTLGNILASQANVLRIYSLLQDFQVDFSPNASIATFTPQLYHILEIILGEETNDKN